MKKILLLFLVVSSFQTLAYDKLSIIERFTNVACPPCATINNSWYNALTANLINSGTSTHIIYNVWWPSSNDPMYLFNKDENVARTNFYNVNSVPSIFVNGMVTGAAESVVTNSVNSGNAEFSPFKIVMTPVFYSNFIIRIKVKIIRDASDTTTPEDLRLRVAIIEKNINYPSPPGSNGESEFFSVCRKVLPNSEGMNFTVPVAGDSIELDLEFIPDENFKSTVDIENIRTVSFIQNNLTKEFYQSAMADLILRSKLEAFFAAEDLIGASPFTTSFNDFSITTDSTSITSWEWDFDNDGVIDSQDPEPSWTFENTGSYTVSLTVNDGIESFKSTKPNYVNVLESNSDVLIVNGIDYTEYQNDMTNFYDNSVCFAGNNVDIWDLYGQQEFDFSSNAKVQQSHLFSQHIPQSVLNLYNKVIWIGDYHFGKNELTMDDQIIEYIEQGGNFLLATSSITDFVGERLKEYCGISRFSPNSLITGITALDPNLVDLTTTSTSTKIQFIRLTDSTNSVPIFSRAGSLDWFAGITMHKEGNGGFVLIGGSPFLYDNNDNTQNFDYIIKNWLRPDPVVGINKNEDQNLPKEFSLSQNYPNPFNPTTIIEYSVPSEASSLDIKIYDVLGKEVAILVNENKQPGNYEIEFDATNLTSGIYYYRISSGEFVETKKMVLLK